MEKNRSRLLRFGGSGLRGEIGNLTPTLAIQFAAALGSYVEGGTVVLVHDARASTAMVTNAVIAALLSVGCKVINAGIAPASYLHWLIPHIKADAGILIGGSHHPAGWNALIAYGADGSLYNEVQIQELLDIYHAHQYDLKAWDHIGQLEEAPESYKKAYFDFECEGINIKAIREAKLNVVMDFCSGSGGGFAKDFAERLGIKLIPINDVPSGILPHSPEPRPRSAVQVQSIINALHADIGFVFNTDMSRFSVVTDSGETLSEEYTFALVADYMLSSVYPKGTTIVTNTCSSRSVQDIAKRYGAHLVTTGSGPSKVINKMIELSAPLGGEGAGSVAFLNKERGYESFHAVARILEAMASKHCTASALADAVPRYHIVKRALSCDSVRSYALIRSMQSYFDDAEIVESDGVRFNYPDGWIFLRASSTEPIIRMIVEWNDKDISEDKAVYVRGLIERGLSL